MLIRLGTLFLWKVEKHLLFGTKGAMVVLVAVLVLLVTVLGQKR